MTIFSPGLLPISQKQLKSVQPTTFSCSKCLYLLCLDSKVAMHIDPQNCCSISLIMCSKHLPSVSGSIDEGWCGCFLCECLLCVHFLTVATVYITMYIGLEKIVWFLNHVLYTSYNQFFELLKGCVGASSFNVCLLLPLWLQEVCMVSFFLA